MIVYVSGPMTGKPDLNFPAFHAETARLRALGYTVINPAEMDAADTAPMTWAQYLRRDVTELVKCNAIVLLEGWEHSKGAKLEHYIAQELGMLVVQAERLQAAGGGA